MERASEKDRKKEMAREERYVLMYVHTLLTYERICILTHRGLLTPITQIQTHLITSTESTTGNLPHATTTVLNAIFPRQTNTFQVVIASDVSDSFVVFLYPSRGITWIDSEGKGSPHNPDIPAQVGFDGGRRGHYMLPKSGKFEVRSLPS